MRNTKYKSGFSLIEVLIAVLLVGLAIASLVAANGAFTKANGAGTDLSTAEFIIGQIRELTMLLPVIDPQTEDATFGPESGETLAGYDDLDDFNGETFSPPISAERKSLSEFSAFHQQITVENVSASDFEQVVDNHGSNFVRVKVSVYLNAKKISSASWLRARY
ncbi:MAG TPA: prepilin-type N-terminal cleavage/methylation domain-containing protein [Sedimentisphaerales bacterium]|nr:prepilin-type N-terminal cleavage/methylation domain-containing protein [Sedimentisphaerales bacterium]